MKKPKEAPPNDPVEPTTALLYMARDFQKRYGAPCRVNCSVDTAGYIQMTVEAWRIDRWIEQKDAFEAAPETFPSAPLSRPL